SPVSTRDRFLYHKTTERAVYDHHRQQHPDVFDVLLWNEHDQLTEFTIGNVVVEIDGRRWTPPQSCGLLAGVFRQALIASGHIEKHMRPRANLPAASRSWLINSLRKWVHVRMRT